jgi:diguanylate cyclase (GGDEF)-like protein
MLEGHGTGDDSIMADSVTSGQQPMADRARYAGYDRIMGSISWLLIALVSLDIKLMEPDERSAMMLAMFCFALFAYNIAARYLVLRGTSSPFKTFVDLMVFLFFIVGVSWFTGKITSPFISLIYLVLMATSLTQGKRVTYFMVGLAISSYVLLSSGDFLDLFSDRGRMVPYLLQLFPFMLIAHLGAMLSGEAESARMHAERLSLTDEVTGLNNMRNFIHLSSLQAGLARRYGRPFTICMLDADNLKKINDQYGHLAGTELIRHTGRLILKNIRSTDIAARYGGDEFVIMYVEARKEDIEGAVQRLIGQMRECPFEQGGRRFFTTLSAGIASYPEDGDDVESVMARADEAMYVSKRLGKNRVSLWERDTEPSEAGGCREQIP